MAEIKNKSAEHKEKTLDYVWFSCYLRPVQCKCDNGNEFLSNDFQEILESYSIEPKPTTVKNPQANLVERVHQTLGSMLRSQDIHNVILDSLDP